MVDDTRLGSPPMRPEPAPRDRLRSATRLIVGPWPFFPWILMWIGIGGLMLRALGRASARAIDVPQTLELAWPNIQTAIVGSAASGLFIWGIPRLVDRAKPRRGAPMGRGRYLLDAAFIAVAIAITLHVITRYLFPDDAVDESATLATSLGFSTPLIFIILLGINGVVASLSERLHRQEALLARRLGEVERQRRALLTTDERVRADIARDLHDHVQTRLLRVAISLDRARGELPEGARAEVDAAIGEIEDIRENGIRSLGRRLAPNLTAFGLLPALRELADPYAGAMKIEFAFDDAVADRFRATDSADLTALALYRVTEQALQNALKHGRAGRVSVNVEGAAAGSFRLDVLADGEPPPPRG